MVANGIFMSKLCYLIQVWGGTENYLLRSVQLLQNKAARRVTGLSLYTPLRKLLRQCGWLSVNQLVFYQSVLTIHKVKVTGNPKYISEKINNEHPYSTRQATGGEIRFGDNFAGKSALISSSFCYRGH